MNKPNKEEIERRNGVFIDWTTFIDYRVKKWKESLDKEFADKLDWTPDSLNSIEHFLIGNFKIDDHKINEKRESLDAIVSYVGAVFRRNIPETIWKIDVEDESNIYFNLPYLVFKLGSPLSPHHLIQDALKELSGNEIFERFEIRMRKWKEYGNYMKTKKK